MEVFYTELADVFLGERRAAFEERLLGGLTIEELIDKDEWMHSIEYNNQLFVIEPMADSILVDTATWEEGETLTAGPFKGKRVMFPRADSK